MDILFDLNVIIDFLFKGRKKHSIAKEIYVLTRKDKIGNWLSASSVDNLKYIVRQQAKFYDVDAYLADSELNKLIREAKIFAVTGKSIRENLPAEDIEDRIIYTNFKRIAPNGIVLSHDEDFLKMPDVISPEEFLAKYRESVSKVISLKNTHIPMLDLKEEYRYMLEDIDESVFKAIAETNYILGPQVKELEDKISAYLDVKHCIGASSGTDALVLALRALAIKLKGQEYFDKSDKIITTPFTFTATGDAILRAGATPVFVDIDPYTYNIDPGKIRDYLTALGQSLPHPENLPPGEREQTPQQQCLLPPGGGGLRWGGPLSPIPESKASSLSRVVGIIPVHLYGQSCRMDEIMAMAQEYELFVLEDVAQAFGGSWNGQKLGAIGTAGAFSFFPSKNLGGFGDGGLVSTNDDDLADLARMLLKHGGKDKYNVDHIGYNARLDTLQAAILLAKLKHIDELTERRRRIAEIYTKELAGIESLILPRPLASSPSPLTSTDHVYHQYTVRVANGKRDKLQNHLKAKNIASMIYYPIPLHSMKVFEGRSVISDKLSASQRAAQEVLSLPIEPLMPPQDLLVIIKAIKEFFQN